MDVGNKKNRKPNFSDDDMNVLVESVEDNYKIITGKFSAIITNDSKNKAWQEITEKVNSVSIKCKRTIEEVKKKWQDAQSSIKKTEGERLKSSRLTGGGPAPDNFFKPWEKVNMFLHSRNFVIAESILLDVVDEP